MRDSPQAAYYLQVLVYIVFKTSDITPNPAK
jgi:hypothetical protein